MYAAFHFFHLIYGHRYMYIIFAPVLTTVHMCVQIYNLSPSSAQYFFHTMDVV